MLGLLDDFIQSDSLDGYPAWLANPRVAGFERQWRGITSFIVGVPFCIKVMQSLGYSWWAPLSYFTHRSSPRLPFSWWSPFFRLSQCVVTPDPANPSRLYPDYIAAKFDPASGFRIAFFESKGTIRALQNMTMCPLAWRNQVRRPILNLNGSQVHASQTVVVATRLQPDAARRRTRKVQVRAWNNDDPKLTAPFAVIADIVRLHYAVVCLQIGLVNAAKVLAAMPAFEAESPGAERWFRALGQELYSLQWLRKAWRSDVEMWRSKIRGDLVLFGRAGFETLGRGPYAIRAGLTSVAMSMIDSLVTGDGPTLKGLVREAPFELKPLGESIEGDRRAFLRSDGVYGEALD